MALTDVNQIAQVRDAALQAGARGAPPIGVSIRTSALIAGLSRAGLKAALAEIGVPEKQLKMRVNQLWSWIYVRGPHLVRRHERRLQGLETRAGRCLHA